MAIYKHLKLTPRNLSIGAGLLILAGLVFVMLENRNPSRFSSAGSRAGDTVTASAVHAQCEAQPEPSAKFACYEQVFTDYMKANGARKTLTLLDELQKMGGYAQSNCHPLTHKVGNIAYHVYGSVMAAVPEFLPVCASGYYHGLLEEYLGTAKDYQTGLVEACGPAEGKVFFSWFQCVHGEGHGIMQYRDNDVPESLKDCDILDAANNAREICYGGVFMENITTDEKTGHPAKYIKPADPIYPCDFVQTQYKSACYFLSSSQILKINHWNFADGFKVCDTRAEKNYRWLCYESMGRDVSGSSLHSKAKVNELCMLGSADMRDECFFGAVRDFINDKGEFDTATDLCSSIPGQYQAKCYSGIMLDLGLYKKGQDYLNVCEGMPDPYKAECRQQVKYN